jgi:hypothetical protein
MHRPLTLTLVLLIGAAGLWGQPNPIEPGWNLFTKEQDVELGKEAAAEVEKEVQVVNNGRLTGYVSGIGQRLAKVSQDPSYPFTFKIVADPNINAFALPGGPVYVNSGMIAAADNEAQVAGVMAHEIGHVVLRHSTNQASKRSIFQLPAALAAGALGDNGGLLGSLANIGLGFGLNSVFMKYSRSAEHDADIVGARMMAAAGYSPVEMAKFFRKLEESGGASGPQFLSDHPNPGNRVQYVTEEIQSYQQGNYTTNSAAFAGMKSLASGIKPAQQTVAAPAAARASSPRQGAATAPAATSARMSGPGFEFQIPMGWQIFRDENDGSATIVPANGVNSTVRGKSEIVRGMLTGYFDAKGSTSLSAATQNFIGDLRKTNSSLRPKQGEQRSLHIDGQPSQSNFLEGPSMTVRGARENVWLITTQRPQGLFYLAMVAPEEEYGSLYPGFQAAVDSIRFTGETAIAAPAAPTTGVYTGQGFVMPYPPDWTAAATDQGVGVRITPRDGIVRQSDGSESVVRGLIAGTYKTGESLTAATTSLLSGFQSNNPGLNLVRGQRKAITVDQRPGESLFLEGPSKLANQTEYVWMVTAKSNGGLFYTVMIAPESEYDALYPTFEKTVNGLTLE